jgi:hypothetical protein
MTIVVGTSTPEGIWVFEIAKASIVSMTGKVTQIGIQSDIFRNGRSGIDPRRIPLAAARLGQKLAVQDRATLDVPLVIPD